MSLIPPNSCTGGDLHSYVARKERLPGSETLFITYQLLQGLDVSMRNRQ